MAIELILSVPTGTLLALAWVVGAGFVGSLIGVITGLIPGLHVNNVALLLLQVIGAGLILTSDSADYMFLAAACLVVASSVTHTFLDVIPSILLGAPDPEMALSVLPGHRMLFEGRALEAIRLSLWGSSGAVLIAIVLIPILRLVMGGPGDPSWLQETLPALTPCVLMFMVTLLLVHEGAGSTRARGLVLRPAGTGEPTDLATVPTPPPDGRVRVRGRIGPHGPHGQMVRLQDGTLLRWAGPPRTEQDDATLIGRLARDRASWPWPKRLAAMAIIGLAGLLGFLVLATPGFGFGGWLFETGFSAGGAGALLFPLFTGLFGIPTLLESLQGQPPPADQPPPRGRVLSKRRTLRAIVTGSLAGSLVSWFPGVSSAEAAILANRQDGSEGIAGREFLVAVSAINTAGALMVIAVLFIALKSRSGAMAAVKAIIGIDGWTLFTTTIPLPAFLAALLLAALLAAAIGMSALEPLARLLVKVFSRTPTRPLVWAIISLLVAGVVLLSGWLGLLILITASAIGGLTLRLGVSRVHMMACLIVPVVAWYWAWDLQLLDLFGLLPGDLLGWGR